VLFYGAIERVLKGASIIALDNSQPQNNPFVAWQTNLEKHSLKKEEEIEFPPVLGRAVYFSRFPEL
jgi:hypothetical protein